MKRMISALVFLLCGVSTAGYAQAVASEGVDAGRYMEQGNEAYREGDYGAALDAYQKAAATGYVSGALYYNTGNAYYRLDQRGQAIRYYLKAERLLPGDTRVRHNLDLVRSQLSDPTSRLPRPYYVRWWNAFVTATGPGRLFVGGWVLCLAAAVLICFRILTGTPNPWARRATVAAGTVGVALIGLAFVASVTARQRRDAVVIAEQISVRTAPGGTPGATAHEGLVVTVLGRHGGWVQVRLPDGTAGWVQAEAVGMV